MRDANAHPTNLHLHSALTIYISRGPIERRVYLYPTGVDRKGCEKSNRDIKPDLGATLTSVVRLTLTSILRAARLRPSQCGSWAGEHPPSFIWTLHGLPLPLPLPIDKLGSWVWNVGCRLTKNRTA